MATLVQRAQGLLQRMIGFSAGIPQSTIVDKTPMVSSGAVPLRGEAPSEFQRTGTTVRIQGFERHPVVQACVRVIVEIASAVDLQMYRKTMKKDREVLDVVPSNFPGQVLLDAPSTMLSSYRLRALTFTHYLIYGNALWFLERLTPNGKPAGIRVVHPEDLMAVWVNQAGYPLWYLWRDPLGYTHTSPVTDIVHFRDLAGKGLVFGYPRAAAALNDIIGDSEASQYVRQVVTNDGAPLSFAIVNDETTAAEAAQAEAKFHEKMVARGHRGRFQFMGGVKDIKSVGFNLRDLEFPDLRRVSREDICAAFGVDPRIVGIASASNDGGLSGEQYVEARTRLIQQTVEPTMRGLVSELDLWYAPEFGDVYTRFNPDVLKALVEDDTKTSERVRAEVGAGLRTVEEGRVAINLPAEYEPDDTLALSGGVMFVPTVIALEGTSPVLAAGDQGATPADEGEGDGSNAGGAPAEPSSGGDGPPDDDTETPPAKRALPAYVMTPTGASILRRGAVLSKEQRTVLWRMFDARAVADEPRYRREALMLFGEERANVKRVFEVQAQQHARAEGVGDDVSALKSVRRRIRGMYKPAGEVAQRWSDRFHPLIGETYARGADHVVESLKRSRAEALRASPPKKKKNLADVGPNIGVEMEYDFHLTDPDVQLAIRKRSERLAGYVGRTTGEAIDGALSVALREGMSMSETAALIDKVAFGPGASYRATMIARTETVGALNQGQFDTAGASGVVAGKEWLTQGDSDVRESHEDCEAEGIIALDQAFSNGLMHPGDETGAADEVINCRCTLLYYDTMSVDYAVED